MVERFVRDEEAAGSNPVTPISKPRISKDLRLFYLYPFCGDTTVSLSVSPGQPGDTHRAGFDPWCRPGLGDTGGYTDRCRSGAATQAVPRRVLARSRQVATAVGGEQNPGCWLGKLYARFVPCHDRESRAAPTPKPTRCCWRRRRIGWRGSMGLVSEVRPTSNSNPRTTLSPWRRRAVRVPRSVLARQHQHPVA